MFETLNIYLGKSNCGAHLLFLGGPNQVVADSNLNGVWA
jgi:hypothetical protein